uniref:Uncharacterized protein n=1 Tax=Setaria italica TaxID=4555 RepID=K3ZGQ3_SETIT
MLRSHAKFLFYSDFAISILALLLHDHPKNEKKILTLGRIRHLVCSICNIWSALTLVLHGTN